MDKKEEILSYLISMGCERTSAELELQMYEENNQIDEVYKSIFENFWQTKHILKLLRCVCLF